jgi:acyl-CoA thioesterase-1
MTAVLGSMATRTIGIQLPPNRKAQFAALAAAAFLCAVHSLRADSRRTIVFFGDSITAGYGLADPAAEAYPALIQREIDSEHLSWRTISAGLSGETTAGGLRRVDWILRQPADVFVLALGGNDGLRGIPPQETAANLRGIIARVRSRFPAARIVLAGMRLPESMGADYAQAFAAVFPSVARDEHVALIPFLLEGVGGRPELNQADGIHPTAAGHVLVAANVWRSLAPLLQVKQ